MKKSIKIRVDRDGNIHFTGDDELVNHFAFLFKDYPHTDYQCTCFDKNDDDDNNGEPARDDKFLDSNSYDSGFRDGYISGLEEAKRSLKYKPYDLAIKEINELIDGLK